MIVVCNECGISIEVAQDKEFDSRLASFKGAFPCFECGNGSLVYLRQAEKATYPDKQMSSKQFHLAVVGFGSPEERVAPETLLEMINGEVMEVTEFSVDEAAAQPRLVVQRMAVKGQGLELHFGASPNGAVIYKVTRWKK